LAILTNITEIEYSAFQQAFSFFNSRLFAGQLPNVLVTLQRHPKAKGYFSPERFGARQGDARVHELAINPDTFHGRTDEDILSTLVHEMAHVWQQECGKPPRRSYHDKQWASKMEQLGLIPSDTGELGGRKVGQHMTHYIQEGGPYQQAFNDLAATGYVLNWQSFPLNAAMAKKKAASKTKFTCPACGQNVWAKPDTRLLCGGCYEDEGRLETLEAESALGLLEPEPKQDVE
jgi:ribosomal protein S27AE